ncbi:CYTH domain-containing protein [Salsuginibacillus kocurii]|uniref:CYTH domain-containing protein n=1 Tax=Salsuginibacillus kocurii TaxID=427078 RepID=UPI00036C4B42|nr:CYTH domain-containing protein [Salsuginibacillus kocurii]
MSEELEIEGKNLVTAAEFESLLSYFNKGWNDFVTQRNHYFDTADFQLKEKGCALRIREKNSTHTLTLKRPHAEGLLEIHQSLSETEMAQALSKGPLPAGTVAEQLSNNLQLSPENCLYLGTLETKRVEVAAFDGLFALDYSTYLGTDDYEIEFEGTSRAHVNQILNDLFERYEIPSRETPNKVKRFFTRKKEITS